MRLTVSASAKINLFLDITGKRSDGYHLINTVMQSVSLYDDVTVSVGGEGSKIDIECTDDDIPCNESNTAYKAAEKFFEYTKLTKREVSIKIKKRIPSQAGLAGGSTDAAAVIIALNELLDTDLTLDKMAEIGEEVGADVPFCIYGGTMSASGIGTILSPLPDMPDCTIVIVKPELKVSTKEAYQKSDESGYELCKSSDYLVDSICNGSIEGIAKSMYNKFEEVIDKEEIRYIRSKLKKCGAAGACMTGSGSAVFGIFADKSEAEDCAGNLRDEYKDIYIVHPTFEGQHKVSGGGIFGTIFGEM